MNYIYTHFHRVMIFILCLFSVNHAFSQLSDWENYTSGNWVHSILNDGDYLWIATDGGLVKMNKLTEEKEFYNRANIGLQDNHIIGLAKDKDNLIWLGSKNRGISYFDGNKCKIFNKDNSDLIYNEYYSAIAVDDQNNKWVGSLFYLNKFDGKTWKSWTTPKGMMSSLWVIYDMKFDSNGILWMGGDALGEWSFAKFSDDAIQILYKLGSVRKIEIDDSDNKWLATNHGLIKYDNNEFATYNCENSSLPYDDLMGIKKDKDGNLWIVGGTYLIKYDGENFSTITAPLSEGNNWITCIEIDKDCIWLGTKQDGLIKYENDKFIKINPSNSPLLSNNISSCADIDKENNVWIGTEHNLIKIDENNNWRSLFEKMTFSSQKRILGVNCAPSGDIWISLGRSDTCVLKIAGQDTIAFTKKDTPVFQMLSEDFSNDNYVFDKKGNVWMASRTGLFKYDGKTWIVLTPENSPLPNYQISSLAIDKQDNLWIGSGDWSGGGLCKYDGKDWTTYTTKNSGLPTHHVATMRFDSNNILWLSCRDTTNYGAIGTIYGGGLTRFDGETWKSYTINNSKLPSNSILDIAIDKYDNLWLATYGKVGITKFDGKNWESYNMENSGIAWDEVSKITLDYKRDQIWLNHLNSGGISTAKVNWEGSSIETAQKDANKSLMIYPNPAKNEISFNLKEGEEPQRIEVYNLSGELICSRSICSPKTTLNTLNIDKEGMYFYKLYTSPEFFYSGRLMVTK